MVPPTGTPCYAIALDSQLYRFVSLNTRASFAQPPSLGQLINRRARSKRNDIDSLAGLKRQRKYFATSRALAASLSRACEIFSRDRSRSTPFDLRSRPMGLHGHSHTRASAGSGRVRFESILTLATVNANGKVRWWRMESLCEPDHANENNLAIVWVAGAIELCVCQI